MEILELEYNSSSDLTLSDATKIEVSGGFLRLKDLGGGSYSTDSPTALYNTVTSADRIASFIAIETKPANTEIKYTLYVSNQDIYYDGANWVDSDGTYAQSNTLAEINAQLTRLNITDFQLRVFLNTSSSSVRPTLDRVAISYDKEPSTSKSYNEYMTRNEILQLAYFNVGVRQLSNEHYEWGRLLLNGLVSSLRADGAQLLIERKQIIPLRASSVVLGSDGVDYECIENHVSTSDTAPATGSHHMTYWKKLSTTAGNSYSLDKKYVSSNEYELPSEIFEVKGAYLREGKTLTSMTIIDSYSDYRELSNVENTGKPYKLYFHRKATPEIFITPYPDATDGAYVIELDCVIRSQDFDDAGNNPDLRPEFNLALIFGLAELLAQSRGVSTDKYLALKSLAKEHLNNAKNIDHETGDITMHLGGDYRE